MGKSLVLINDAPNVTQYVFTRVARMEADDRAVILVTVGCGLFQFIAQAMAERPGVSVRLLPAPPQVRTSSPGTFCQLRRLVRRVMADRVCEGGLPDELWYFGDFCDVVVSCTVASLARQGVRIVDASHPHYTFTPLRLTRADRVYCLLMRALLHAPQRLVTIGSAQRYRFLDSDRLGVVREPAPVDLGRLQPFLLRVAVPPDGAGGTRGLPLLFFESASGSSVYERYPEQVAALLERFAVIGYRIYVKPHPRLGLSPFLQGHPLISVIPGALPGELLDYSSFKVAVAVYSVAVVHTASLGVPSFCLESLFRRKDPRGVAADLERLRHDERLGSGAPLQFPETEEAFAGALQFLVAEGIHPGTACG